MATISNNIRDMFIVLIHVQKQAACELEKEASSVAGGTMVMSISGIFKSERHILIQQHVIKHH